MITAHKVRLAMPSDAADIAEMARDFIEHGLGWGWTERRVLRNMQDRATNVAVIRDDGQLLAFGIMKYGDEAAHLFLLGVHFLKRRRGIGSALVAWLETCARTAGIARIRVEARVTNQAARAFYRELGYREIGRLTGTIAASKTLCGSKRASTGNTPIPRRSMTEVIQLRVLPTLAPLLALLSACALHPAQEPQRTCYHRSDAFETDVGYCQAVRIGDTLYISGIAGQGDMPAAVRSVYERLQKTLEANGLTFADVVKENVYATDLDAFIKNKDIRKQFYKPSALPAATWVQVQRLYTPSLVVEVELVAGYGRAP